MIHGPVANTLVLCVGLPLKEVAMLARSVGKGTVVMAAGDVDTAWRLLGSADPTQVVSAQVVHEEQAIPTVGTPDEEATPGPAPMQIGRLTIDPPAREVISGGSPVRLSAREFDLLTLLASDLHRVWPFASLVKSLWHTDYLGDHDQLASTVKRLRKRLGPDTGCEVHSVHGVGYRLVTTEPAVA